MTITTLTATGVATRLLSAALCRTGSFIFQKIGRLHRIDAAITSGKPPSPELALALEEFEIVLGSYRGELTIRMKALLEELERSGLVTAIGEAALIDREDPALMAAFEEVHKSIFDDGSGNSQVLFRAIFNSFRITLQEKFGEKRTAALLKSCTKEIGENLTKLNERLSAVSLIHNEHVGYEVISAVEKRLARSLQSHFRDIRVETNKGAKLIDIGKIYIPSKLQYKKNPPLTEEILAVSNGHSWAPRADEMASLTADRLTSISYPEFKDGFRRVVVLGDPGGGKSTLCQYLCYQLAKAFSFATDFGDDKRYAPQNARIPLHVVLRSFELARKRDAQLSIFDYILRELRNHVTASDNEIRATLLHILNSGSAVLAFDGLDEILETARRREFVTLVSDFTNQFPLCPALITSRLIGYQNAPMPDDFDELILQKFDKEEIESYVTKFLTVYERTSQKDARDRAKLFVQQTDSNANDLRQNPLLLGLMAFLFSAKGDVPANRPEIYKECATLMFEKWDRNRSIKAAIPEDTDLLHLFADVASNIYGNIELEEGVSQGWLLQCTGTYFGKLYENPLKARAAAKSIVEFLTGRSWVMSEFGSDVYRFTHRTFLEYFYARYLDEAHETVVQVFKALRSYIVSSERDVVAHLAIQTKSFRNQRRTIQTLAELERVIASTKVGTKRRNAAVLFAAHSLEYLPGPEGAMKPLIARIYEECLLAPRSNGLDFEPIIACCNAAQERSAYVQSVIGDLVLSTLYSNDDVRAGAVASLLSSFESRFDSFWRFPTKHCLPFETVKAIRERARSHILLNAHRKPLFARLKWEWYAEVPQEFLQKQLFSILPGKLTAPPAFDPAIRILIFAFDLMGGRRDDDEERRIANRSARALLAAVGSVYSSNQATSVSFGDRASGVREGEFGMVPFNAWHRMFESAEDDVVLATGVLAFLFIYLELLAGKNAPRCIVGRHDEGEANVVRERLADRNRLERAIHAVAKRLDQQALPFGGTVRKWLAGEFQLVKRVRQEDRQVPPKRTTGAP